MRPVIAAARVRLLGKHKPVDTVLGFTTLSPAYSIEVDAIVVADHHAGSPN